MKQKCKCTIVTITVLLVSALIVIATIYWKTNYKKYRSHCINNLSQIKWALNNYTSKYGTLPSSLKKLKESKFAPMSPPNRFVCSKNKNINQAFHYAYSTTPIDVSYHNKNRKIILFCRPESKTGYVNAICDDLKIIGGFLDNKEKDRLINLYESMTKKQLSQRRCNGPSTSKQ